MGAALPNHSLFEIQISFLFFFVKLFNEVYIYIFLKVIYINDIISNIFKKSPVSTIYFWYYVQNLFVTHVLIFLINKLWKLLFLYRRVLWHLVTKMVTTKNAKIIQIYISKSHKHVRMTDNVSYVAKTFCNRFDRFLCQKIIV